MSANDRTAATPNECRRLSYISAPYPELKVISQYVLRETFQTLCDAVRSSNRRKWKPFRGQWSTSNEQKFLSTSAVTKPISGISFLYK